MGIRRLLQLRIMKILMRMYFLARRHNYLHWLHNSQPWKNMLCVHGLLLHTQEIWRMLQPLSDMFPRHLLRRAWLGSITLSTCQSISRQTRKLGSEASLGDCAEEWGPCRPQAQRDGSVLRGLAKMALFV